MKIKRKEINKKKVLGITLGTLLTITVIGFVSWYVLAIAPNNQPDPSKVNLDPPTQEQLDEGQRIKEDSLNDKNTSEPDSGTSITVTSTGKTSDSYQIRVLIDHISDGGSCTIDLASDSTTRAAIQTVPVQALPHGSTCAGFNIPLTELAGSPIWTATIKYSNNNVSASTTTEISLNE